VSHRSRWTDGETATGDATVRRPNLSREHHRDVACPCWNRRDVMCSNRRDDRAAADVETKRHRKGRHRKRHR
jgi:hypothetical protein